MFKKSVALILAIVVLVASFPIGMFASATTTLPDEVANLGFVVGDTIIDEDFEDATAIPDGYELRNPSWDGWPGNAGSLSLSTYTVSGADDKGLQLNTSQDDVILIPTISTANYVYEAEITLTNNASGSFGLLNGMSPVVRADGADSQGMTGDYGANRMVIYAPGHSSNGTYAYYHTKFQNAGTQQNITKPSALTGLPTVGTTLTFKVYSYAGNNYFYINDNHIATFANAKDFGNQTVVGFFASSSSIFISKLSVKALVADTTSGDEDSNIIGTNGNKVMTKGDSLLAYDFTQSTLADGTLPDGFTYGGANTTPALDWGWGASGASVSAKMATYNNTKVLQFTANNCDALIAAPAVNTRDYVYEITFIPTLSGKYVGISNQTWGTDTLSSSQWFAVQDNAAPYHKYKGTDSPGGLGEFTTTDAYRATLGEEVTLKVVSYNGINYYFINDRYVTGCQYMGSLGTNETTDRVGLYTYSGNIYIKSMYVNAVTVTEETLPEGIGQVGDSYYIEGEVIYENNFDNETVGTLPEGWSYGHPNGTGETKTSYGWAANTSATATAAVVDHATLGKVVQFGSSNTDAFMALPATGTMNYVYEATVVSNTGGNNSIGHANNFYAPTNEATGVMYNSIYPSGSAKYSYRGNGTGANWDTSYNHTSGEAMDLKIVSLNGNNYIYYNDTLVAVAPWRGGAGTSDNPGFYTYNGNMYVTDVKVTKILTADIEFDAMRVVVNEDETVDLEIEFSFDKTQEVYSQYIDGDYSADANENFVLGTLLVLTDSDVSADLTIDYEGVDEMLFSDGDITQDADKVYVKTIGADMPEEVYQQYVNVRPFVYVNGLYFYGDGAAYSAANLANGAYMTADTEAQKALVEKVLGDYDEFVVGSGSKEVKFTLFSDFHYKAGMYSTSMADLRQILKRADDTNSAFILSGGDMCNDLIGSPELTNTYLNYITEEGELLTAYNIYGNHELESANNSMSFVTPRLTNDENVVWGTADGKISPDGSIAYFYFEENGFRFVCLDNNYNWNPNHINGEVVGWEHYLTNSYGGTAAATNAKRGFDEGADAKANTDIGSIGDVQMAWLEEVLLDAAAQDIPCIVVGHTGYSGLGFGGGASDAAQIREVYAKANAANPGTVLMSINGHIHTNNQGWNEGVFYMDTNTVRNNWWQSAGFDHYTAEHTYLYEEYDSEGNLLGVTEKSLNTLSQAKNTWFSQDPLSCVITINDAGVVTIDGMESKWAYDIVPAQADADAGVECRITTGTFWNCDIYGHIEDYVIDGDKHYVECTVQECGYASSSVAHTFDQEIESDEFVAGEADCDEAATYYYSCVCGAAGTETFVSGTSLGHDKANEWTSDNDGHWHKCDNCTDKLDYANHTYDQQVTTDAYKASSADCDDAATYYYSCVCGKSGTATFEYGSASGHNPATDWTKDGTGHWHACSGCTEKLDFATHTYDQQVEKTEYLAGAADCDEPASFYYSCVCGAKGTTTFESGTSTGHDPLDEWESDGTKHWHNCGECGEKVDYTEGAHNGGEATCSVKAKCADCGAYYGEIDADNHDLDEVPASTASHDNDGNIKHYKCSYCGKLYDDENATNELSASDVVIDGGDHTFDKEVVKDEYLASGATSSAAAKYYKSCECGAKGTETFSHGDPLKVPPTGDVANALPWVFTLAGSVLSLAVLVIIRKRRA